MKIKNIVSKVYKWFKKGKWSPWTTTDHKGKRYAGVKFTRKF